MCYTNVNTDAHEAVCIAHSDRDWSAPFIQHIVSIYHWQPSDSKLQM